MSMGFLYKMNIAQHSDQQEDQKGTDLQNSMILYHGFICRLHQNGTALTDRQNVYHESDQLIASEGDGFEQFLDFVPIRTCIRVGKMVQNPCILQICPPSALDLEPIPGCKLNVSMKGVPFFKDLKLYLYYFRADRYFINVGL